MSPVRQVRNVHERVIAAPADVVGPLLDRLASAEDPLWPAPNWPPMRFDRPLAVGADGGHGPIRYRVTEYQPGRRITFRFTVFDGHHELTVEPLGPDRCRLRHVLEMAQRPRDRAAWLAVLRWAHDAVLEDLLDNAERAATGTVRRDATWSPWVRLINRVGWRWPTAVPLPSDALLARTAFDRVDFTDSWQLRLRPGMSHDPDLWRGLLPRFTERDRRDGELLLGDDAGHLDFRVSLLIHDGRITFSTVVRTRNRWGRLHVAVVRRVHPLVVRALLRRAHRRVARSTPTAGARWRLSGRPPVDAVS